MAEDGRSALTPVSRTIVAPETGASSRTFVAPASEPTTSTSVTAEIPAVPAGPSYGVLLPDGTIWYPGSQKRLPAPMLLRVLVWVLAVATVLAAAGVFVIHYHPAWANPFRRVVGAGHLSSAGTGGSTTGSHPGGTAASSSHYNASFHSMSPQPAGLPAESTAYRVPSGAYTIRIGESIPGHDAWEAVWPAINGQPASVPQQQQILHGVQTVDVSATGEVKVQVAAQGGTVALLQNGKVLGSVAEHSPWIWWVVPAGAGYSSSSPSG